MLAKRIIGSLIVKDGVVVQSLGFERYLPVGLPEIAVEFQNDWGVDEIIVLDIGEARETRQPNYPLLSRLAKKSFVPLTIGGGIDTIEDMRKLIHGGADKFVLNKVAVENPKIISEAAAIFGNQCVVISIDARKTDQGYEVCTDSGQTRTGKNAEEFAKECTELGAGEILIRAIERDGSKQGFDLELLREVRAAVNIPVIAAGGCGHSEHAKEALDAGAEAVAVGNLFHFSEHSVTTMKAYLKSSFPIRLDTHATYDTFPFDTRGRIGKQPDEYLEKLRFEYYPKEVI